MIIRLKYHDESVQEWEWTGAPTLLEARLIKERAGLTIGAFIKGFEELDPDCVTAMLYVLHRRSGNPVNWDDIECAILGDPAPGVPVLEFDVEDETGDVKEQAARKLAEGKARGRASGPNPKADSKPSSASTPPA